MFILLVTFYRCFSSFFNFKMVLQIKIGYKNKKMFCITYDLCTFAPHKLTPPILTLTVVVKSIHIALTSWPVPGCVSSQSGGGPPYFLCPVVTSRE